MTWEVFSKTRANSAIEPWVTISTRPVLSMNRAAYAALGEPEAVCLLWDGGERLVGVVAAGRDDPHSYVVRHDRSSMSRVTCGAFAAHYGIDTSVARRYPAVMVDDVLSVDLRDGIEVSSNARRQAS
jgi:hypothetical protein